VGARVAGVILALVILAVAAPDDGATLLVSGAVIVTAIVWANYRLDRWAGTPRRTLFRR
jgi:hypothetical protein